MTTNADVVICGAGIAGISAAFHLCVRRRMKNVLVVDELRPLTLTSDKSSESYRNWFPGPGDDMVAFMTRSIDILDELARESDNRFLLNRRGYLFVTADDARIEEIHEMGREPCDLGAGEFRVHEAGSAGGRYTPAPSKGFENLPDGADLILDRSLIRQHFPCLNADTVAVLHARRCGWLSAQQLGMYMLEEARAHGAKLLHGRVEAVDVQNGSVRGVQVTTDEGSRDIACDVFVNAAGPYLKDVGRMLGVDLPVHHERHVKLVFHDTRGAIPLDAPMMLWLDPVDLPRSDEEREALASDPEGGALLQTFPSGIHGRPFGGDTVMLIWTYDTEPSVRTYPITWDPAMPEILLRGMSVMVPALAQYFGHLPQPIVDGGYYTKTEENRALIGPLPVGGAYIIGALSGFGIMASSAAGDLLAAHVTGATLPPYAPAFHLDRYQDPAYQALLTNWPASGQL
jgi:glycine/D-amino acid oxidase-like deaminating enzyme